MNRWGLDPVEEAFRAGQQSYRAGLLGLVNLRRAMRGAAPVGWPAVGATPSDVAWSEGSARLLRYRALPAAGAAAPQGAPVLMVASLINRPYVLDLLAERSVVRRFLEAGRDVWLLDWGHPRAEDANAGLRRYALELLPAAARVVVEATSSPRIHVLGYCMGGTFALLAAGAGRLPLAGLVAMATPVELHDAGLLSLWCRAPGFDAEEIARTYGNVPAHLLQPAFKMLDPVGLATKLVHLDDKLGDDDFVRFFLAMETWLEDSVAFAGRAFADWVKLYRTNALRERKLTVDGVAIDLGRIDVPVLSLVAEADYITPPASSLAIDEVLTRAHHTLRRQAGGHIGLSTSSAAHKTMWPEVIRWLPDEAPAPARATRALRAPSTAAPARKGPPRNRRAPSAR